MSKIILIDAVYPDETRVVICNNRRIEEFDYETAVKKQLKGNIYLAKVTRVEPSLQAAFVDYGGDKHGFLPFSEIHPDYYHLPLSDRDASLEHGASHLNGTEATMGLPENIGLNIRPITPPDLSMDENEEEEIVVPAQKVAEENIPPAEEMVEKNPAGDEEVPAEAKTHVEEELDVITEEESLHDEALETTPKRSMLYRQYKIQEVIKRNQIILVQVIKEERGNKGASLTSYISLAGRYCVLMPNSERQGGVSKRIASTDDRKRLKSIIESLELPDGTSVIVRTAGQGRSKAEIKRDYDYLVRLWNSIREHTLSSKAPAFIHVEGDLIKRSIRDMYDVDTDEILIQGDKAYRSAKDFMKMIMPSHALKVKQYKSKIPIFSRYQVDEQLSSLYSPIATLDSGGYIVINPTEALISIDVNSGRSTSERNIEETAVKTNLEAAAEIARQLRLRDLSGLIVIDFIDMSEQRHRRAVEKALKDALEIDRAKIQLGRISLFGLLEMSRQRLRSSFIEANMIICPHCNGRGMVRALESTAVMALRAIESEVYKGDCEAINIYASADTVMYILNTKRKDLATIEERYDVRVLFHHDPHANADSFSTEKAKRTGIAKIEAASITTIEPYMLEGEEEEIAVISPLARQEDKKKSWRRGGSNKGGNPNPNPHNGRARKEVQSPEIQEIVQEIPVEGKAVEASMKDVEPDENAPIKRSSRRRSSRRGGRRHANTDATVAASAAEGIEQAIAAVAEMSVEVPSASEEGKPAGSRRKYRYGKGRSAAAKENGPKEEPESLLKELWKRIID